MTPGPMSLPRERGDDAIGIAQDELFVGAVSRFVAARDAADAERDIRASLSTALRQGKYSALVMDAAGRMLLPLGAPTDVVAGDAEYAARAAATRAPVFASVTGVRGSGSRLHEASREQRTLRERFEALSSMVNDMLLQAGRWPPTSRASSSRWAR